MAEARRVVRRRAWESLGYGSWRDYWIAEFGERSLSLSYKQIGAGRVDRQLEALEDLPKPSQDHAIALAPLLDQPEALRDAWEETNVRTSGAPTAAAVREVVSTARGFRTSEEPGEHPGDHESRDYRCQEPEATPEGGSAAGAFDGLEVAHGYYNGCAAGRDPAVKQRT